MPATSSILYVAKRREPGAGGAMARRRAASSGWVGSAMVASGEAAATTAATTAAAAGAAVVVGEFGEERWLWRRRLACFFSRSLPTTASAATPRTRPLGPRLTGTQRTRRPWPMSAAVGVYAMQSPTTTATTCRAVASQRQEGGGGRGAESVPARW